MEPEDALPDALLAARARGLTHRGGGRRNGLPQAALAVIGLLGVLLMLHAGRRDFGPRGVFGPPGQCSAAATVTGTAGRAWCTVTDARVIEVEYAGGGSVMGLLLGTSSELGKPASSVTTADAEFGGAQPSLDGVEVGDAIGFVGSADWVVAPGDPDPVDDSPADYGVATVTWKGEVLATTCADDCSTPRSRRVADASGLGSAIAWPVFFGLWAVWLRARRTLPALHRVLPIVAALWFIGLIGSLGDSDGTESLTPMSLLDTAAVTSIVLTVAYGLRSLVVRRRSRTARAQAM